MNTEDKVELVENILGIVADDERCTVEEHTVARLIVCALEATDPQEEEEEEEEEDEDALEEVANERDQSRLEVARLESDITRAKHSNELLQAAIEEAKNRSTGHLTEARDQAVAELQKVQAELEDLKQNGGRDRVDKLVKVRMSDERREFEETVAELKQQAARFLREREAALKELEYRRRGQIVLQKERDDLKWENAQLHKELALYRPEPTNEPAKQEEAKP